jgi:hypothetical protein
MRVTVICLLMILMALSLLGSPVLIKTATAPVLVTAASEVPQEVGAYEEDFTTYTYKDYTDNADWNIWDSHLTVSLSDAVNQRAPSVAPDGGGGVFVVWKDNRNGNWSIYAQRLDVNGNRLWENDLQVNSDGGIIYSNTSPSVGVGGSGAVVVVWVDERNGDRDIYAQRLDADGTKLWPTDLRVSNGGGTTYQDSPYVGGNDDGNVVVVWQDERNGGYQNADIYAQQLGASGNKLWPTDIRVNSDSETVSQGSPTAALDGDRNAVVVWKDSRNGNADVYAQELDAGGNKLWAADVRVNSDSATADQGAPAVAVDGNGNAVVVWEDSRFGNDDIYGQRLDANGNKLWVYDVRVHSYNWTESQWSPAVAVDSSGSAVVVWRDFRSDENIYGQRLDADGNRLWGGDRRVNSDSGTAYQLHPAVAISGSGNVTVVWQDHRRGSDDIYSQQLDVSGYKLWVADVQVNSDTGTASQWSPALAVDGNGNAVVVWQDFRNGDADIYAQKVDASGNRLWTADMCVNSDNGTASQWSPAVVMDSDGNSVVVWQDIRNGDADIYVQKIDASGNRLWAADTRVNSDSGIADQSTPAVAVNGDGNAVIAWNDERSGNDDIYAQKLDASGNRLWAADVRVNSDSGTAGQFEPAVAVDDIGNATVVWTDRRNGHEDIYAHRLDASGNKQWTDDVRINSDSWTAYQWHPTVAVGGDGNLVVVWSDYRNGSGWNNSDVYAQRLDATGNKLWATDVMVNSYIWIQQGSSTVAVDSIGNAVVVWYEYRNDNYDIYAQRLTTNGEKGWADDVRVNSDSGATDQSLPAVALDWSGNAVVVWNDQRNCNDDVFAQKLNVVGGKGWLADLPVVYPDRFYLTTGIAQSQTTDTITGNITEANLTSDFQTNGGSVQFFLANNGGTDWFPVTPGVTHVFTTTGSDLRWRAVLAADPIWPRTPVVDLLHIEYSTDLPFADDYEPDDTCAQASPLQVNGAVQAHNFHQTDDKDWAWFDVISGTTYVLQTAHAGPNADTVLELDDICDHPILTDTNAFGHDARQVFTASFSGTLYASVSNHDGSVYGERTDYDLSVRTYHPNGLAVIVAGHNDAWWLQSNIDYAADQAYLTLLGAGFPKGNVRYLGPNPDRDVDGNGLHDDIVATATITNVRYAIQDWPREQGLALGVPFYVYLMDHGHYDLFLADGSAGWVTAPLLDLWLSNLEATTGADQITVIIDACKSGSFIDVTGVGPAEISGHNRVIVASTTSQANAYPSKQGSLFSDVFWTALGDNQDVWSAYQTAKTAVEARGLMQTPWLDDNGDAVADERDGALARGRGLAGVFGGSEPVIDWLTVGEVREDGVATATAQVRDDFNVMGVHVEVYPPGYEEPEGGPGETPLVGVPTATLQLMSGEVYTATLTGLTGPGFYRVVGYAVDDEGNWALPAWVIVGSGKLGDHSVYLPLVLR